MVKRTGTERKTMTKIDFKIVAKFIGSFMQYNNGVFTVKQQLFRTLIYFYPSDPIFGGNRRAVDLLRRNKTTILHRRELPNQDKPQTAREDVIPAGIVKQAEDTMAGLNT